MFQDNIIDILSITKQVFDQEFKLNFFSNKIPKNNPNLIEGFSLLSMCESVFIMRYIPKFVPFDYSTKLRQELLDQIAREFLSEYLVYYRIWISPRYMDIYDTNIYELFDEIHKQNQERKWNFMIIPITNKDKILCYLFVDKIRKEILFWSLKQNNWIKKYSNIENKITGILEEYTSFFEYTKINITEQQLTNLFNSQPQIMDDFFRYFPNTKYLYRPKNNMDTGLMYFWWVFLFIFRLNGTNSSKNLQHLYENFLGESESKRQEIYIHFFFFIHYIIRRIFRTI